MDERAKGQDADREVRSEEKKRGKVEETGSPRGRKSRKGGGEQGRRPPDTGRQEQPDPGRQEEPERGRQEERERVRGD